jgi:plastocyanin
MHFSTIFAATALAGVAVAEMHTVAVSNKTGALVFVPDSIKAAEGDTVMFKFWPKNHSVAQSTFAKPCDPMDKGFWSGFVPTESTTAVSDMTYTFTVKNASAPVWFYCTQGKHCQNGMVGVINPPYVIRKSLSTVQISNGRQCNRTKHTRSLQKCFNGRNSKRLTQVRSRYWWQACDEQHIHIWGFRLIQLVCFRVSSVDWCGITPYWQCYLCGSLGSRRVPYVLR